MVARLNVARVARSSWFKNPFTVVRRRQDVDVNGVPQTTVVSVETVSGIVTPTGSNSLTRADAYATQMQSIQIITTFRLRTASLDSAGVNWMSDIAIYGGVSYVVNTSDEYSQFGEGWLRCDCIATDYQLPPVT